MKKPLCQESLKLIACLSMLLDHIGMVFLPWPWLRIVGRLAFPIYCFLLCEGLRHTGSLRRYGIRLAVAAVVSEIPFDLLFFGGLTAAHQNVMITLLLGFLAATSIEKLKKPGLKLAAMILAVLLAEVLHADYGGIGVMLILAMALSREPAFWVVSMAVMFLLVGGVQIFGLLALVPIFMYSGQKGTSGPWVQRLFYLFYPAHMVVLLLLDKL